VNHFFINGRCLFCGQPLANANYMEYDAQTENEQDIHAPALLEDSPKLCPGGNFFLIRSAIIGVGAPIWMLWGWEFTIIYLILLYFISHYVVLNDPRKWLGIHEVQLEYEKLTETLQSVKRLYYLRHIKGVIQPLMEARDKAFRIIPLLAEEPMHGLELKLRQLEEETVKATSHDMQIMGKSQAKDLRESIDKLKKMAAFLEKFEANKRSIAASLKLLRTKLLLAETTGDEGEVQKILEDLQSLHAVYDRVNEDFRN